MEFLIISGMSGAGKSRTADILEDYDYYCVDNMPVALLTRFAELCLATRGRYEQVALVIDVRERDSFASLFAALDGLWEQGLEYSILFVEADLPTLVQRYKESRRPHPLLEEGESIEDAINREHTIIAPLRERADYIINTTGLTSAMLQSRISDLLFSGRLKRSIAVTVTAFGYKYGLPMDADLVFDVRFLPNPYYVQDLRPLCGLDKPVSDFVFSYDDTKGFMEHLRVMLDFLIPLYIEEGKFTLNIAIGCTGGKHRSVSVAKVLVDELSAKQLNVNGNYRDVYKG